MNKNVSFILFDEWSTSFSMSSAPFRLDYKFYFYLYLRDVTWCSGDHTQSDLQIFV